MTKITLIKDCPCCHSKAIFLTSGPVKFPFKVGCINSRCGIQTPWVKTEAIAKAIWNRRKRIERKVA